MKNKRYVLKKISKKEMLKLLAENLKKAYEVSRELDKHSVVTREILDTRFTI